MPPRPPFSSLTQKATRMVRRGSSPSFFMRATACRQGTTEAPSSCAPWPTSPESSWPPMPEGDADGAPRFEPEFLHEGHGLQTGDDGSAIVLRALADVPGIEMAADDDHFRSEEHTSEL